MNTFRMGLFVVALFVTLISLFKVSYPFFCEREKDLIYRNVTAIQNIEGSYTFAVLGDNKNSISTFSKIIKSINNDSNIRFVINTGDMVFDGNPIKYDFFLKQLARLKPPMLPVPGNHDVADNSVERYMDIFGPLYYSFHVGDAYFIILDNSNEKRIDPWQMLWLEKELKNSISYKYTFVFMHVPLFDPRKDFEHQPGHSMKDVANARKILKLLTRYNITCIFFGHIHAYYEGKWDRVPYIITGGAGAELLGRDPQHDFYHYIKVHIGHDKVSYKLVKIDSPDFNLIDRIGAFIWIYMYSFFVINYWIIVLFIAGLVLMYIYLKTWGTKHWDIIKTIFRKK